MSFLFFSGGRTTTLSINTLFFDKKQAFSKLALEYI